MKETLLKKLKCFSSQDNGAIAIFMAFLMVALLGFAGLAIDAGLWNSQKRQLQLAADAAAVGGVFALGKTGQSTITAYATYDAGLNGCTSANNCTIVSISNPPTSGSQAGNTNAVEVILSKPTQLFFTSLFLSTAPTINVRAVATLSSSKNVCFGSLGINGIGLVGNSTINAPNCTVYSNTNLSLKGTTSITAGSVNTVGTINDTSHITATSGITQNAPALIDLYQTLAVPSYSGCDHTNYSGSPASITPGVYCGGFKATGGTITMAPGTYIVNGGDVDLHGNTTLNGTGVTLVLTSSTGTNYPQVDIAGTVNLNLSAPTSGTFNNILMYEDRNAPSSTTVKIAGNTTSNVQGVVYVPSADLTLTGVSTTGSNACLRAIASTITINGTSDTFSGPGCTAPQSPLAMTALVE